MKSVSRESRFCQECKIKCESTEEFKKVIDLKASGLSIYVHNDTNNMVEKKGSIVKPDEIFVLHNSKEKMIKRYDYIRELGQFKTKCCQCKALIQRIRYAIGEISDINASEIRGLCQHCKQVNPTGKCKRCEFIANKFFCNRVKQFEERQIKIELWLCKVRKLLQAILENNFCRHNVHQKSLLINEFDRLLKEPEVEEFASWRIDRHNSVKEIKNMLENFRKTQNANRLCRSDENLYVSSSEITTNDPCKCLMDDYFDGRHQTTEESDSMDKTDTQNNWEEMLKGKEDSDLKGLFDIKEYLPKESSGKRLPSTKGPDRLGTKKREETGSKKNVGINDKSSSKTTNKLSLNTAKNADEKKKKKGKSSDDVKDNVNQKKQRKSSVDEVSKMLNLMKQHKQEKVKRESKNKENKKKENRFNFGKEEMRLPKIDMSLLKPDELVKLDISSESIIELDKKHRALGTAEMIKGIKIVPFDPRYKDEKEQQIEPLLFKTITIGAGDTALDDDAQIDTLKRFKPKPCADRGNLMYELSNQEFINKGWTKLPTTKVMKRMNIYKMIPANMNNNWFSRYSDKEIMLYKTGEKLAEIPNSTTGSWYYKNGSIALSYYPAEELNAGQRIVIYSNSCKEDGDVEKALPVTVLASFDSLGNGVVYDHFGNVRLKYNQSEGVLIDETVGPPSKWKWHMLNDPPVWEPVFIDTYTKERDPRIEKLLGNLHDQKKSEPSGSKKQEIVKEDQDMIAIELDNFLKEKSNKMLERFKPFQIRMKALKINDQFSLKIFNQMNIYILFNDGPISMKLDLGMQLISSEIIGTDTSEISQIETPYDKYPARSRSLANIQDLLKKARKQGKIKNVALKSMIT